jgi:glycosyltransferase involved in cell wall biosynthesis
MNILILNWRDKKNPTSGGAEILTHEIAQRWVEQGNTVTLFTSYFPDAKKEEVIDGVRVIREGKPDLRSLFQSVHYKAFKKYKRDYKGNIDVVIDEIHGMPFFTALYVSEPVVPLICEVADTIWDKMFSFPWNKIGKFLEHRFLLLYKSKHFLTISESTRQDLIKFGADERKITVIPMGISRVSVDNIKKEKVHTAIFVARINKMKGIEDAIDAFSIVIKHIPDAKLWIVGRGEDGYVQLLKHKIALAYLEKNIVFWDFVSERKKFELMAKAHVIISPSAREGFGLTIPEAGSVGTPAVVYNVSGLRDIVDDSNGLKVDQNTPEELAKQILKLFSDRELYKKMRDGALFSSKQYDWDKSAKAALGVLQLQIKNFDS